VAVAVLVHTQLQLMTELAAVVAVAFIAQLDYRYRAR
jgi:hypothetical protein